MLEILQDPDFLIVLSILVVAVIAIIIGSYRHIHITGFKPVFKELSDGSVQMECPGFGGIQATRTKRFYTQYKVGMELIYKNNQYKIVEFKEIAVPDLLRPDLKIVAYLEKI